jgi:abhydrolase domain-containing protein 6
MWIVMTIAIILLLGLIAVHVFRWPLFKFAVRAQRSRAGLVEKTIEVDGHSVAYLDGGSGEPLVLIHGFGANKDNWLQIAPLLAPHYRLIIPDLPGFGDSTRDDSASYSAHDQLARLHSFVEQLKLDAVHLGGNSMGGWLAGLYAARYPTAVKSQWLLAPAGVAGAEPSELFQAIEKGDNALLVESPDDFSRLMQMCFTKVPYVPKAFQRCLCEQNIREQPFNAKIFGELSIDPPELEQELANSEVKTQILWGDGDRILHCSGAAILGNVMRSAQTIVMEKMGHCPMLERPQETADLYLKFQGIR